MEVRLREMTPDEFAAFRARAVAGYAQAHVESGDWSPDRAQHLAAEETDSLLPDGLDTAGMLLVCAETEEHGVVGRAWVALEHAEKSGAWIYDIEIEEEHRGKGLGRALLRGVERLARERGVDAVGLNVFADNRPARALYAAEGYQTTSLHMRKTLK
jgi:ribosomal protein S18 acetylase RimI-like enzyme